MLLESLDMEAGGAIYNEGEERRVTKWEVEVKNEGQV